MVSFKQTSENKITLKINIKVFNETVITKTLYWLHSDYLIFWNSTDSNIQEITLENKMGNISDEEALSVKNRISQNLIDFKTRNLINQETKYIRNILYIKAFANDDDFEDYNLLSTSDV